MHPYSPFKHAISSWLQQNSNPVTREPDTDDESLLLFQIIDPSACLKAHQNQPWLKSSLVFDNTKINFSNEFNRKRPHLYPELDILILIGFYNHLFSSKSLHDCLPATERRTFRFRTFQHKWNVRKWQTSWLLRANVPPVNQGNPMKLSVNFPRKVTNRLYIGIRASSAFDEWWPRSFFLRSHLSQNDTATCVHFMRVTNWPLPKRETNSTLKECVNQSPFR